MSSAAPFRATPRTTRTRERWLAAIALLAVALLAVAIGPIGCLSPRPATPVRYFEPELPASADGASGGSAPGRELPAEAARTGSERAAPLRAARATAAASLADRFVWRLSAVEVAFDEGHRWATPPAALLDRAIADRLFARGSFSASGDVDASELLVHLETFEGRLDRDPAEARIALTARLRRPDGRESATRVEIAEPLARDDAAALAAAMGPALDRAAERVAAFAAAAMRGE